MVTDFATHMAISKMTGHLVIKLFCCFGNQREKEIGSFSKFHPSVQMSQWLGMSKTLFFSVVQDSVWNTV